MTASIQKAANALAAAKRAVALSGAGISVESGIPPFRGKGGLWEKYDPVEYAHIQAFERHPEKVWQVLFMDLKRVLDQAAPNDAHRGLFQLEKMGYLQTVITQNIDGLHQRAGSTDVIEFHGTFARLRCMACHRSCETRQVSLDAIPPRCSCGGILRPDVVMFGELIPFESLERAQALAAECDLMLVVGTSSTVQPAAGLPLIAKHSGAFIIEINPEKTPLSGHISDVTLLGQAGQMVRGLVAAVRETS